MKSLTICFQNHIWSNEAGLQRILKPHNIIVEKGATIGNNVTIEPYALIKAGAVISDGVTIDSNTVIGALARIGKNTTIGSYTSIGAKATIGEQVSIGVCTMVGMNTNVADQAFIGSNVFLSDNIRIGSNSVVENCAKIFRNLEGMSMILEDRVVSEEDNRPTIWSHTQDNSVIVTPEGVQISHLWIPWKDWDTKKTDISHIEDKELQQITAFIKAVRKLV